MLGPGGLVTIYDITRRESLWTDLDPLQMPHRLGHLPMGVQNALDRVPDGPTGIDEEVVRDIVTWE